MDDSLWLGLAKALQEAHLGAMTEGGTTVPTLLCVRDGNLIGRVGLRPVYEGKDATMGIAEMSLLAAATESDHIVVGWETYDVAFACRLPPLHDLPGLNILRATRNYHTVHRYPYLERVTSRQTSTGLRSAEPDWQPAPPPAINGELEPAIQALVSMAWERVPQAQTVSVHDIASFMREKGYVVDLTTAA